MKNNKNKKNKKWIKARHKFVTSLLKVFLGTYCKIKYSIKVEKFKEQQKRPYLILFNHQTAFDQFFVGMSFKGAVYYVASEDIFSIGFASSLIRYLVAPIPIKKQTADVKAVMTCLRVAKEGGTIAIAPEGNRTFSGKTEYINPSIVPLAKKLNMPIALYRIEEGYGVHPRWSDKIRKGKMRGYVARVINPEEYNSMSDDELYKAIYDGLYVNEAQISGQFKSKRSAEYLERAIYVCPTCGLSTFKSTGDKIECLKCGKKVQYLSTKQLKGVGFDFPFEFVSPWYDYQSEYINGLNLLSYTAEPCYTEDVSLFEVIPYKSKNTISEKAQILLYGDRITVNTENQTITFPFDKTHAITVLGKNKVNIYHDDKIYQIKGDKRFNALKYVHFYHRCKNIIKGDTNGKFLGL